MKSLRLLFAAAVAISFCSTARLQGGITIFDNLNVSYDGEEGADMTRWLAQGFEVGNFDTLVQISLNLTSGHGDYAVELWTADGQNNRPGSLLSTIAPQNSGPGTGHGSDHVVTFSSLNVPVTPNSRYYIVVKGLNDQQVYWGYASSSQGTGAWKAYSSYEAGEWSAPEEDQPFRMSVEAVPEPSTWIVGAFAGLVLVGSWARRKWLIGRAQGLTPGSDLESLPK